MFVQRVNRLLIGLRFVTERVDVVKVPADIADPKVGCLAMRRTQED